MSRRNNRSALYRVVALLLAICLFATMLVGCGKDKDVTEEVTTSVKWENEIPYVSEDFEGSTHTAFARGEVTMEVVDDEGGKALKVGNRVENWNGANFTAEEFRGNSIAASARVKTDNPAIHLSLQYDLAGSTSYSWIGSGDGIPGAYTSVGGNIDIPAEATNIFVYVEADGAADLYIDDVSIKVNGEYTPYLVAEEIEYTDFNDYPALKELYADYFDIGCAIPDSYVGNSNQQYIQLVTNQFSTITMENEFKPEGLLDAAACKAEPEKYNESPAVVFDDALVATLDYCRDNGIMVRGHTLTWHSQTPEWLFYENYDTKGKYASRELMLKRMENYIKSVLTWCEDNYPGMFYAWDVTNEAIDDGSSKLRSDVPWTKTVGQDWVEYAFKFARQYAGKGVQLFYNDYNAYQAAKSEGIIELLKPIAEAGNIDGVGMQGHISTGTNIEQFVAAANKYVDELGVVLNVTELDIEMPKKDGGEYLQGVYFNDFFSALIAEKKAGLPLENVTIWGLTDSMSWKADKYPLLFNGDLSNKMAFDGVVCAVNGTILPVPSDYVAPVDDFSPIYDDYEGDKFVGRSRFGGSKQEFVTENPYEGEKCLRNYGGETYEGYSIDVDRFIGKTIKISAYVRSSCEMVCLTAEIDGVWPRIAEVDTSKGDWVAIEGTYEIPSDASVFSIYFETPTTDDFFIDNLSIEMVEAE